VTTLLATQPFNISSQNSGKGEETIILLYEFYCIMYFARIFAHEPEARDLFKRVNGDDVTSPEFKAHSLRVLGGLDMSIALMDDEGALSSQLQHLQGQHKERKIPGQYFDVSARSRCPSFHCRSDILSQTFASTCER